MQWTMQLEERTEHGEVNRTELLTFSRPAMDITLAEVGLMLAEAKTLLAKLMWTASGDASVSLADQ